MMFVHVVEGTPRHETEEITKLWQTGLWNSHIQAERYLLFTMSFGDFKNVLRVCILCCITYWLESCDKMVQNIHVDVKWENC